MDNFHIKNYVIAELGISIKTPWNEIVSEGFQPFCLKDTIEKFQVLFKETTCLPEPIGNKVFENKGFSVFLNDDGSCTRLFHDSQKAYAVYAVMKMELDKQEVIIEYLPGAEYYFCTSKKDFFHIGWEKILIHAGRIIFHSACIETEYGGILFSGPSGIGKSTQANLWCKYRGAKMINGDKPVLRKCENGWRAYGSPYAGSSKCHVNESCHVNVIVMLNKSEHCSMRKLNGAEAFRRVYEQIIINSWDKWYVTKVCDLVSELVNTIPVYEMSCTPTEEAVRFMEKQLERKRD